MLTDKTYKYLRENRLFTGVDDDMLRELDESLFEIKTYEKDDLMIEQNAEPDGIYLIAKGSLVIKKFTIKDTARKEAREIVLNVCNKSEFVGEMALVSNKKRSANVYCFSTKCKILFINTDNFYKIYEKLHEIQMNLGKTIVDRLGETSIRATNEMSKYKKLLDVQLDNADRNNALLKSHKEMSDKNVQLEENIKMVKRKSIIDTIVVMVNTFKSDIEGSVSSSLELIKKLSSDVPSEKLEDLNKLKDIISSISEQLDVYQNSSSISFDKNKDDEKIIVFKK
ncbi:MAG: cyclic nucleotide-binding domain-containing protein [Candidatus Delongbacteria bacterium]|jgi:CRP-like cAMP-binding protein|nr:cyclic nucleotide-binding domain-containing protein [Candidatus Delongbacteria bacterium]